MVAALDESDQENPLAALTRTVVHSRLFGSAPGAYGAGLQALIDSGSGSSATTWERLTWPGVPGATTALPQPIAIALAWNRH